MNSKYKHIDILQRVALLCCASTFLAVVSIMPAAAQLTDSELESIQGGWAQFDPDAGAAIGCQVPTSGSVEVTDDHEADMIRAVIGIAKTLGVGQQGALIGIMTALVESNLQNYANSTIPESRQSPDWTVLPEPRPVGSDYDSVGIMQQRVGRDEGDVGISPWSTYGTYEHADSETRQQIVWQIMDPLYAAQAFYGTPSEAELPDDLSNPNALRQGLLNLERDWRSLDPGDAAQAVQGSAFPDRYAEEQSRAQSILDQYWADTPAAPLAVPLSNFDTPLLDEDCDFFVGTEFEEKIMEYSWSPRPSPAAYSWSGGSVLAMNATEAYRNATQEAQNRGEYVGGCSDCGCNFGIDCGGFVTRVMRDSGLDPDYNITNGNVAGGQYPYLEGNLGTKYEKLDNVQSTADLQPGDIWINHSLSHTYMYVGHIEGFEGDKAGSSISTGGGNCGSWRAPMAGTTYGLDQQWYRLVAGPINDE